MWKSVYIEIIINKTHQISYLLMEFGDLLLQVSG